MIKKISTDIIDIFTTLITITLLAVLLSWAYRPRGWKDVRIDNERAHRTYGDAPVVTNIDTIKNLGSLFAKTLEATTKKKEPTP